MFEMAFANDITSTGNAGFGSDVKSESLPVHPGEKPAKAAHKKWAKKWRADLSARRFGPLLRGEMPFEIKKLTDRAEIVHPDPAHPTPSIVAENAKIKHQNDLNKVERDARLDELKNMVASLLQSAMQETAPLRLAELQKKYQIKDSGGAAIDHSYDGVAMFLEDEAKANDGDVSEWDEARYVKSYEIFRDKKLPDDCRPQAVSERYNLFNTHVNPYLGEMELKGERLGKFLLSQLPKKLGADVRTLRRELEKDGELGSPDIVAKKAVQLVESAHDGTTKTSIDEALHMVHLVFDDSPESQRALSLANMAETKGTAEANDKGVQDKVTKLLAQIANAAAAGSQGDNTSGRGKKRARKAAAALAAARSTGENVKLRLGNRLPEGQKCSAGTCEFAHDLLKPGEPCYRDPRWPGPLPAKTHNNPKTLERIKADRETEAKRLGVACKPLRPPTDGGGGAPAAAVTTNPSGLFQSLREAGLFMADMGDDEDAVVDESGYGFFEAGQLNGESPWAEAASCDDDDGDELMQGLTPADASAVAQALASPSSPVHAIGFETPKKATRDAALAPGNGAVSVAGMQPLTTADACGCAHDDGSGVCFGGAASRPFPAPRMHATAAAPQVASKEWLQQAKDRITEIQAKTGSDTGVNATLPFAKNAVLAPASRPVATPAVVAGQVGSLETFLSPSGVAPQSQSSSKLADGSVADVEGKQVQAATATRDATDSPSAQRPRMDTLVRPDVATTGEHVARMCMAVVLTGMLALGMLVGIRGMEGAHLSIVYVMALACSRGGMGVARSFALVTTDAVCPDVVQPTFDIARVSVCLFGLLCFVSTVAEMTFTAQAVALIKRLVRGTRSLTSIRDWLARIRMAGATVALIVAIVMMAQGVGASVVPNHGGHVSQALPHSVNSSAQQVYLYARKGMEALPGPTGDRCRRIVDEMAVSSLNVTVAPAFMGTTDLKSMVFDMGGADAVKKLKSGSMTLTIGDSGAAIHVVTSTKHAVPGSIRPNNLAVKTANGTVVPKLQCDSLLHLQLLDGSSTTVTLEGALIMDTCAHNLVSVGKLARLKGVSCTLTAGDGDSYFTIPDGRRAQIFNMGVLVIPDHNLTVSMLREQTQAFGAVAQGARRAIHVPKGVVHARGNHSHWARLRDWHKCTADIPREWSLTARDEPCDACLRANCPEVSSDSQVPKVEKPGDLLGYDVYSMGVKHVHGGQSKVLGIHDYKSKLNWVYLLKNETTEELLVAWREFAAYAQAHNVTIKHVHTDNAKAFTSEQARAFFRDELKCRYTTIAPYSPKSNSPTERQWRTMGNFTRSMLTKSKLPRNYAWYALRHGVAVQNTLPFPDDPNACPLSVWTGTKPKAAHFRVWGCVVYAKIYNRVTKMSDSGVRGIHLGRASNQSGYLVYDPETKLMHVSIHCRFVETALPGLTMNREGYEMIVPDFADDYNPNAPLRDESELEEAVEHHLTEEARPDPIIEPTSDRPDSPTMEQHQPMEQPQPGGDPQLRGQSQSGGQPPASVMRPRRAARQPVRLVPGANLTNLAMMTMQALTPGGEAFGTQFLGLNAVARGSYFIYLYSGPLREGDFASWVRELSASEVYVLNIDTRVGGYAHDMASVEVKERLKKLAADPNCLGVLTAIPCGTWSPARFVQPGPPPLRKLPNYPEGIPDGEGNLPASVQHANKLAEHAIEIVEAAAEHGAHYIFENPVGRDASSQFAIKGREEHASLWKLPAMVRFAQKHGAQPVHFDQCRTGSSTMKTTQLLCSPTVVDAVRERLGHLICNHPNGTHEPIVGMGADEQGNYRTKPTELFTSELNRQLAEAMLAPRARTEGWLVALGSAIEPYTNRLADALAYTYTYANVSSQVDETDPLSLTRGILSLFGELDDEDRAWGQSVLNEIAPMLAVIDVDGKTKSAADELRTFMFTEAFAVAAARRGDCDNPGYKQAMSGPERELWRAACDEEVASLDRKHIYQEVPEDSLPSWDPKRRRALELIDLMWVLKVKYNELNERVRWKARATFRGDQEAKVDAAKGLSPAETFAPTTRHNTVKCGLAASVVRAAASSVGNKTPACVMRVRTFDIETAFLEGEQPKDRERYILPPAGYQKYDRRGVRIVWRLTGNLYGTTTAPRVFNKTLHAYLEDKVNMTQSAHDPCYYYKIYANGSRLDLYLYVDDGLCIDDAGPLADADLAILRQRFTVSLNEKPTHFLGMNLNVISPTKVQLSSEGYIKGMAKRYIPDWETRPKLGMPATDQLTKAYEKAHAREVPATPEMIKRYGGKVGALVYTMPCVRVDACATISRLSRALTFPTAELEAMVDDTIVYLAQTASDGVTFDGMAPDAGILKTESDSDWAVGHSTTGWATFLAGAAFAYASKRQACIAMSSTEAEIIAASAAAIESVHFRLLLEEMGLPQDASPLYVDNSGAVELSRDRKSCHRSRHVDRRYFKVRELEFEGKVKVEHIDTKLNSADLLTKPLPQHVFDAHKRRLMNLGA